MPAKVQANPEGQSAALWMSTIAFTVCFAVWTIFSIIGIQIKKDLGLSETQFGLLVGTPILTGSLIRIFLGIWTDQYGGRVVYTLTMLAAAVATFLLTYATTYPQMLIAALGVGVAGGSFSVGVAYVSRWYPPEKQGVALGIFGAGNVGSGPQVVIIDDTLAKHLFGVDGAIGRRVAFEFKGHGPGNSQPLFREVVGVVRHVRHYGLTTEPTSFQVYAPLTQLPIWWETRRPAMALVVRTETGAEAMVSTVRRVVVAIDPSVPVYGVQPMETYVS